MYLQLLPYMIYMAIIFLIAETHVLRKYLFSGKVFFNLKFTKQGERSKRMSLTEVKQEIKTLSRLDKLHLIEEISKMLRQEEGQAKYFMPDAKSPVFTPHNEEKASAQLQKFLEQQTS